VAHTVYALVTGFLCMAFCSRWW